MLVVVVVVFVPIGLVLVVVPVGLVLVVLLVVVLVVLVIPIGLVIVAVRIVLVVVLLVCGRVLGIVVGGMRGLHVLLRLMLHLHLHRRILVHRGRLVGHHRLMPHRGGLVHHSGGHVGRLRGRPHGGRPLGLGHPRGRRSAAAA